MLKKCRENKPILYCVLAYVLWLLGMAVGGTLSGFASGVAVKMGGSPFSFIMQMTLDDTAGVLCAVFLLARTGRLGLLGRRGMGLPRGLLYAIFPLVLCAVDALIMKGWPSQPLNSPPRILLFLVLTAIIGMSEDFLCRAVLAQTLLERYGNKKYGPVLAVLLSTLLFSVMHFLNIFSGGNPGQVLLQVLNAASAGIMLATVYFTTGNIWVPVILHALWDLISMFDMEDGIFQSGATFAGNLNENGTVETWIVTALLLLYAFVLYRTGAMDRGIRKWFAADFAPEKKTAEE